MNRSLRTSPSNLRVFTACLLSFLMLLAPVATMAGSVKAAEANAAKGQPKLTADQKLDSFLFNAPAPAATPDVKATMTDSFADADADNKAELGETITYTADITNNGPVDATGVKFDATLDPNTDFVTNSVKVSPLAFDDTLVAFKDDTLIQGAPGLLANDTGTPAPTISAVVGCADVTAPFDNCDTTQAGGKVNVDADGGFTYTPPAGYEGPDSFQYTISNGQTPDSTATVTLHVDAAPTVISTSPTNGASGADPSANITVTFSENVNVTANTFKIECPTGTNIPFALTPAAPGGTNVFTLNPNADLPSGTTCTVTVDKDEVSDVDTFDPPDHMAADYVFSFGTESAPAVTTTSPANGDNGVATNVNVVVNFTENVTATTSSFKIECPAPGNLQPFAVTGSGTNQITLNPTADLPAGTTCTVTVIANQISDTDAFDPPDHLAADYVFSFTTDAAPAVQSTTPTNGQSNLATNTTIQINFTENVNATTSSFKIECPAPGNLQTFTLSASPSNTFTLTPTANLPGGVTCTVTVIANQISDQDGNDPPDNMVANYVFTFTTDAAPSVSTTNPTNGATHIGQDTNIVINFSEPVNYTANAFKIECPAPGNTQTFVASGDGTSTVTLNPDNSLPVGALCTVTVDKDEISDTDTNDPPNNMVADYVFSFTIDTPPAVTTTSPTNSSIDNAKSTNIVINFDENVDVTTNSFKIECPAPGNTQAFAVSGSGTSAITLNPTADLPPGVICTVTVIAAQVSDSDAGDPPDHPTADYVFSFGVKPEAVDDARNATGNVRLQTAGRSGFSALSNDIGPSLVVTAASGTTTRGGQYTIAVDGTFTYNPPRGVTGNNIDGFDYTISNNAGSDVGTVVFTINDMLWFINNTSGACSSNCDGRFTNPYTTLAAFDTDNGTGTTVGGVVVDPEAGDHIFIYTGTGNYTGPVTLENNQRVIGQGATGTLVGPSSLSGITLATDSDTLPSLTGSVAGRPTITSTANGINLATANRIHGLSFSNVGNLQANYAIIGSAGGALIISEVKIDNSSSNGGGISDTGVVNVANTIEVTGATPNTIVTRSGVGLQISNQAITANNVTFEKISVGNNDANLDPANGINVSTTGAAGGLKITGTGATDGSGGTIQRTTSSGVRLVSTNSVDLKNMNLTTNGQSQTVIGSNTNCGGNLRTGNNLQCVANLYMQTVTGVSLTNLDILNSGQMGISGNAVTTFTLTNSNVTGNGNEAFEDGITFQNLLGTNSITDTIIKNNAAHQIHVGNTTNSTSLTLGITGTRTSNAFPTKDTSTTTIGNDSPSGANTQQGILFETNTTGTSINMALNITGVVFPNNYPQNAVDIQHLAASGVLTGTTTNSSFDTNAGGVILSMQNGSGTSTYNVTNSEFNRSNLQSILYSAANPYNGALTGTISGNTIGTAGQSGSACEPTATGSCNGIDIIFIEGTGSISTRIQNNTLQEFRNIGLQVRANGVSSPDVNVNIVGNTLQNPAGLIAHGIETNIGTTSNANVDGCLGIGGAGALANTITGTYEDPGVGVQLGIVTNVRFLSHHKLPGYAGSTTAVGGPGNAVTDFIIGNNSTGGKVFTQRGGSGDYPGGAACVTPLILAAGGIESALTPTPLWSSFALTPSDELQSLSAPVTRCSRADAAVNAALPTPDAVATSLTQQQLDSTVAAAIERWAAAGLTPQQLATLRGINFSVANLAGPYLGEAHGRNIQIDTDAGGAGWYVDATPLDDSEFGQTVSATRRYTDPAGAPAGRVDLLTAIMHEMGHRLDIEDSYASADSDNLMYGYLMKGERRLPTTGQTAHASPGVNQSTHFLSLSTAGNERRAVQSKAKAQPAAKSLTPAAPAVNNLPVTIGTIPAGKMVRVTFQVTVKSAATYTGTASKVSAQGTVTFDDPNNPPSGTLSVLTDDTGVLPNTGETDPTDTPVDSQPDLVLTKDDGGATAVPGGTIAYTLTYNNTNGKRAASGVVITETVPANTTFNAGASTAGWSCTPNGNAGSTCTLSIPDLPAGDAGSTATFAVTVDSPVAAGVTLISNTASIADDGTKGADGTPADNTGNDTTPVTAVPNMRIVKTADSPGVKAGQVASYTLAYSNIGNQGATGVVITETVPADSTFNAGASTAGWVCAPNNNAGSTCTITIGAVAGGGSGSVTFAVTTSLTPVGTQVDNTASIADDGTNGVDPDGSNNTSSASTQFDDPPTLGNYSDTTVFVTQGATVTPSAAPTDDNPGFDLDVTVSAGFTGTATVDDTTGVVTITNAGPANTYTVTVKNTDNINQVTTKTFQLTVNKSDTTTALASSKNPSFNNQNVTFTATVTSNTAVTGPPTGAVDFFDGATLICDDAPLDGTGKATCSTSTLSVAGSPHSITATYNGDAKFLTSTSSPALMQVVNPSLNFTVNTLGDAVDDNLGDDRCDTDGNNGNGDQCTLRAAIQEANSSPSDDVVSFSLAPNSTITLLTALPDLGDNVNSGNLDINGPGATQLKVERASGAATQFRVLTVPAGKTVNISGMTISGGDSALDGGGVSNAGTLTLSDVVVSGNSTDNDGGGVRNNSGGTLTITGSTISGNTAANLGGGVSNAGTTLTIKDSTISDNDAINGGGVSSAAGTLALSNSTISGNRARNDGGGLRNATGSATLTNVTVTDNRADSDSSVGGVGGGVGGGIRRVSGTVTLRNTIVAENFNDQNPANTPDDISGTMDAASSFNLIGAGGAGTLVNGVNNNQVGVDPKLRKLEDNGGPTKTHALKPNSPALDAGDNTLATNAGLTDDQRGPGFNRFVDSTDADAIATVDIGAFEAQVSIEKIANRGTAEDTPLPAFNFEVAEDAGITGFTVTATSSDQTLVKDVNLVLGGAGNTRTLAITPEADKFGTATITVTVSGLQSGTFPVQMTDTFDFAVTPVADMPDAADVATNEDTQSGPIFVTKNPVDGAEVTHFRVSAITGGTLYMPNGTTMLTGGDFVSFTDGALGLRFTPLPNYNGPGHFSVQAATGNIPAALGGGIDTSTITVNAVNDQPTLGPLNNRYILEDSPGETITMTGIGAGGGETQTLVVTAVSSNPAIVPNPTVNYTSPNSSGTLVYAPVANANGTAIITVTVNDGGGGAETVSRTFSINITPVNDAPSFTKGPDQVVGEDAGPQSVSNWATAISPGAPNESGQVLTFVVTGNSNPGLFSSQPAISPTGTLTYKSVDNASGTATVTIILKDGSGTANSGQDMSSPPQTFNITVNAVNDAPVNTVPGAQTVVKNGTLTFSQATAKLVKVTDVDAGAAIIKVALTAQKGTMTLPMTSGLTFTTGNGTNNQYMIFTGTISNINAAMNGMQFKPNANYVGAASLTIFSNDLGNTPGPAKTDSDIIAITVTNPPPSAPSTFSLGAPVYSTSEGALRATVTVKRDGDTSAPASVNYKTTDPSAAGVGCGAVTGQASNRCDYATAVGTLRFAAGESSREISIPLVNDAYSEGPESFTVSLSKPAGAKLAGTTSAVVTIADDDDVTGAPAANPLGSDEFFVRQLYVDVLGREPDEKGLGYWLNTLKKCGGSADCGRAAVASAFFKSDEFKQGSYFAYRLYRAAFGRVARFDELTPDMARLNSARDAAELALNKADLVSDFMARAEFKDRFGSRTQPADYVDALLLAAGLPNHPQRKTWVAGLADGSLTRGDVLWQLAESADVSAKFMSEAEVVMQYHVFLKREADAGAANGLELAPQTPDLLKLVGGFLDSAEYRQRFGQ